MNALLLSGGFGTRLKPLSDIWPKCLMPDKGLPLMEYWLHDLKNIGVDKVLVNTHYHASIVQNFIDQTGNANWVSIVHEEELLGTAGTLWNSQKFFDGGPFFLIHSDNFCRCDFQSFYDYHFNFRPAGTLGTMMTFRTEEPQTCGVVETDSSGRLVEYYEKLTSHHGNIANGAVFILENKIFKFGKDIVALNNDFCGEIVPQMKGHLATWHNANIHLDIGTPKKVKDAQNLEFTPLNSNVSNWHKWFCKHPIHHQIDN